MSRPRVLQIERLETRDLLSGSKVGAKLKQSAAPLVQSAAVPSITSFGVRTSADTSKSPTLNSTAIGQTKRWDTILIGTWYVPPANMLAYLVGPGAIDPVAVADETIFNITTASGGVFSGTGSVQLTVPTPQGATTQPPTDFTIQGVVTPAGHIRIEFTLSSSQVTGIGNMEKVNHEWRMTMQLASSSSVKLFHWANMTKLPSNGTLPTPVVQPDGPLGQGRWLLGTRWMLTDSSGTTGQFEIDGYRKGYFLGRGLDGSNFSVFASVTPEGSLLLLLVSSDGTVTRIGTLKRIGRSGLMQFRSYEGDPGLGVAVLTSTVVNKPHHNQL